MSARERLAERLIGKPGDVIVTKRPHAGVSLVDRLADIAGLSADNAVARERLERLVEDARTTLKDDVFTPAGLEDDPQRAPRLGRWRSTHCLQAALEGTSLIFAAASRRWCKGSRTCTRRIASNRSTLGRAAIGVDCGTCR